MHIPISEYSTVQFQHTIGLQDNTSDTAVADNETADSVPSRGGSSSKVYGSAPVLATPSFIYLANYATPGALSRPNLSRWAPQSSTRSPLAASCSFASFRAAQF